jgi:SAM-dependent methyltransferase
MPSDPVLAAKGLASRLANRLIPQNSNRRMIFRALRDIAKQPRTLGSRLNASNFANLSKYRRRAFLCPVCGEMARPLYDFPNLELRREHKIGVLRETLQCSNCLASMRQRSLAVACLYWLNARWATSLASISEAASVGLRGLRILDTDNFSSTSRLLRGCAGYIRCSYLPSKPWGTCLEPNYFNQDLQHLTFSDGVFDIVLTSDVMEHVRDCDSAHREIFRVLSPGGAYIFNVPFDMNAEQDIRLVDTSTDEDVYLCKPQIHGDPLSGGVLAYRVFGREIMAKLQEIGFEVEFRLLQQENHMIIDGDVFIARKPV